MKRLLLALLLAATSALADTGVLTYQAAGLTCSAAPPSTSNSSFLCTSSLLFSGNNLSDIGTAATARTNLGLGTLATQSGTFSGTSSGTNSGDQTITLTGGVTGSGTGSFAATVVTNANLTGDVTSVGNATTLAAGSASNLNSGTLPAGRMPALTGDVTTSAGAVATTIAAKAVTLAKMNDLATATLIGRNTAGTGVPEALTTIPTGTFPALTGDVTTSAGSLATTYAGVVPFAKGGISAAAATPATTGTMTVPMTASVITITPTGSATFNASGGTAGAISTFSITTSGTSSFTLTWGTNFRKTGTLATGTTSARFFAVTFVCIDGTTWLEIARTAVQT